MIGVVDYGSGNVRAIANIFDRLDIGFGFVKTTKDLAEVTRVVLPGVGAFGQAMQALNESGLREGLDRWVLQERKPLLGICVGMQLMADSSEESPIPGLGWIRGAVRRFEDSRFQQATRLPHMGWNTVSAAAKDHLLGDVDLSAGFYFLHSYYFSCLDPARVLGTTDYGGAFTSIVRWDNVYGVQFHPEKSHHAGVQVLKNFAGMGERSGG
jgi:glutamine amidotransferase